MSVLRRYYDVSPQLAHLPTIGNELILDDLGSSPLTLRLRQPTHRQLMVSRNRSSLARYIHCIECIYCTTSIMELQGNGSHCKWSLCC